MAKESQVLGGPEEEEEEAAGAGGGPGDAGPGHGLRPAGPNLTALMEG